MLREVKSGEISEAEAIKRLERSPLWIWTAMAPESKLLLVIDVGTRTLEMAQRMVHQVFRHLAPDCVPLCVTDQEHKEGFHSFPYTCPDDCDPIEPSAPRPGPYVLPTPAGCRGSSTGTSGCADRLR
jgi:hypothetical protein